ncbi:MAG: glycosyltransferase, partial [Actinomycetota bacterium]
MSLTVAILCQDEERNIEAAIASAAFADEVLIVDGGSKDRSIQVAIAAGARVVERPFDAFAHQRNFA